MSGKLRLKRLEGEKIIINKLAFKLFHGFYFLFMGKPF